MELFSRKNETERRWRPRSLYFSKKSMSVFTWLAMEKKEKEKENIKNKK